MSRKAEVTQLHPNQVNKRLEDAKNIAVVEYSAQEAMAVWENIEPYLALTLEYSTGRYNIENVKDSIASGRVWVFVVYSRDTKSVYSVIAAEGFRFPQRKVFSVVLCGGEDVMKWGQLAWEKLCDVAIERGYNQIEVVGRRGWGRFLSGAKEIGTTYAMDLKQEED